MKQVDNLDIYRLLSGGIAGASNTLTFHPVDCLKVRVQLNPNSTISFVNLIKHMYVDEGIRSFWRGCSWPTFTKFFIDATQLAVNGYLRASFENKISQNPKYFKKYSNPEGKILIPFWSIWIIGAVSCGVTVPLQTPVELIKTQLQTDQNSRKNGTKSKYRNQMDVFKILTRQRQLTRSFNITMLRLAPGYGTYLCVYEMWNRLFDRDGTLGDNDISSFFSTFRVCMGGGIAGTCSWGIMIPLDNIKSHIQSREISTTNGRSKISHITKEIYHRFGIKGFYRGLNATIIRAFPANLMFFYVYEFTYQMLSQDDKF